METTEALEIVRSLAEGRDPETKEAFGADNLYQKPRIIRALYRAVQALERLTAIDRRKERLPGNTGKAWSKDEDGILIAAFTEGAALESLAAKHQRTIGAIRARLVLHGKLEDDGSLRYPRKEQRFSVPSVARNT